MFKGRQVAEVEPKEITIAPRRHGEPPPDPERDRNNGRRVENIDDEMSANDLGILVRRVSEASRREIGNLMGELQALEKKLETDGDRLQHDIKEYVGLSQQVMQLTTIVSDSVKQLPEPRGLNR